MKSLLQHVRQDEIRLGNCGVETNPQSLFECPLWRFYHAKVDSRLWVGLAFFTLVNK